MRHTVEQFFKELEEKIDKDIEAFTVEWRQYEALAQIQLEDDFYVFVIFSWSDEDCTIEFMVGDENAVIQQRHIDKIDKAIQIVKFTYESAKQKFVCLQRS